MRASYPVDEAVGDVLVHELPTPGEALGRDVRAVGQDVSRPLVVNLVRPTGLEQVRQGEPHEQVAERGRVEHAGVVEDDSGHGSVAHIQVLAQRRKLVEGGVTPGLELPLVGEQVFEQHPPVSPDLPARDGPLVEQLHQMRAGDVQEVGRLLGRELGTNRRQGHRVPLPQLGQGTQEQPQRRGRQDQLLTRGAGLDLQAEPARARPRWTASLWPDSLASAASALVGVTTSLPFDSWAISRSPFRCA